MALISKDDCVAVQVLGGLGADLGALRARVISEIEENPEDRDYSRPLRLRLRGAPLPDAVQGLLEEIDDRLSAIELHLGIAARARRRGGGRGRGELRPARKCRTPLVMCRA